MSERDRGLMEGLLTFEQSLSPHGFPWREVLDPLSDGWYKVTPKIDNTQMAVDRWHKGTPDPPPGTRLFVEDERKTKADDLTP